MKLVLEAAPPGAPRVQRGDQVTVHYTGYLKDQMKKFWSTRDSNKPFSFQVGMNNVVKGWDEGCLSMKQGESARFTISSEKAFGRPGFSAWGIPPNASLVFDTEMLSIQ